MNRRHLPPFAGLPYRGPGVMASEAKGVRIGEPGARPLSIALPPEHRMAMLRGGRALKRWRYVGVFDQRLMLCAGDVHVGPTRQTFWAVWDREERRLRERTSWVRHGRVHLAPGRLAVRDRDVEIELALVEEPGIETVCADGGGYAWTRKQGGVPARGQVTLGGRRFTLDALAVVDDSAGYHARDTSWHWSAGVGRDRGGAHVAWNLVSGINDPRRESERSVWVEGTATEPGPVHFDETLERVSGPDGLDLRFAAEATRQRNDNLWLLRSEYQQPFGTFGGSLPGDIELEHGLGVMERHRARW